MKEEWLFQGAYVPVDAETTAALVAEIKRLIDVVGGMALAQPPKRPWQGITREERTNLENYFGQVIGAFFLAEIETTLKQRNT